MKPTPENEQHNALQPLGDDKKKATHYDVLEAYVASGGEGIELSEFQKQLLDRLRYADEKIRQSQGRFKRDQIAGMIKTTYNVSRDTAYKYIVEAERIFSSSFPLNKQYEIGARIELLKEKSRAAAAEGNWPAFAMIERVLADYYKQYPDVRKVDVKKTLIMNVVQQFFDSPEQTAMSLDEAIQQAEVIENEDEDAE